MNRLENEHLHLLLDEPFYVLPDHGDHPIDSPDDTTVVAFEGYNVKGIAVFVGDASEDDVAFLFKGLNALDISLEDIALFKSVHDSNLKYPDHTIRIDFTAVDRQVNFDLTKESDFSLLSALSLSAIQADLDLKKQFWLNLKDLFGKL